MLKLKRISFVNFLSYGNTPTTFDLDTHATTLIRGRNGHGKSVILDLIIYALYGRPYRNITKPQLINSINKNHMIVDLEFSIGLTDYRIIRGMKPNVFDIFKNGVLIEQDAAMRDYQDFLETNILKINEKTFKQIAVLGSASYIPFMQLAAYQRRELIESILDIEVFSKMNAVLKDRVASTKEELKTISHRVELKKVEAVAQQKLIKIMEANSKTRINEFEVKKAELEKQKEEIDRTCRVLSFDLEEMDEPPFDDASCDSLRTTIRTAKSMIVSLEQKQSNICLLDECPTCMQSVDSAHHDHVSKDITRQINNIKSSLVDLELEFNLVLDQRVAFDAFQKQHSALSTKLLNAQRELSNVHKQINEVNSSILSINNNTDDVEKENDKLKKIAADAMLILERKNTLTEEKHLQDVAAQLLKDTGIKTAVVKEYLPVLNKLINKYLADFEFFVEFNLDESFTEVIKSRGRDVFTYSSFSEGEKRRIDLSILMAFRQLAAMKNSAKTNILIFDEILDSNLDLVAREQVGNIIREIKDSNTIVISHADANGDDFDCTLQIEKKGDFSTYSEIH